MAPSIYDIDNSAAKAAVLVAPNGTPLPMDSTDRQRVSLYGKNAAAGDTALRTSAAFNTAVIAGTDVLAVVPYIGSSGTANGTPLRDANSFGDASALTFGVQAMAPWVFNNTTWDRPRNNVDLTLLASAARTASTPSPDQTNYNGRGVVIFLNITAVPGTDTITMQLQAKDVIGGFYTVVANATAQSATGLQAWAVYPGVSGAGTYSGVQNSVLPRTWRVNIIHSAGTSFTYSVGASNIL